MRILILSSMVAGSMAACAAGTKQLLVLSGYGSTAHATLDYSNAAGIWSSANIKTIIQVFTDDDKGNVNTYAVGVGDMLGVPWPLSAASSTNYYDGASAMSATKNSVPVVVTASQAATASTCFKFATAPISGEISTATCAAPAFKFYSTSGSTTNAACATEIGSPDGAAGHVQTSWLAVATGTLSAASLGGYGVVNNDVGDALNFLAAGTFTRIKMQFFGNADCSTGPVANSATAVGAIDLAMFSSTDAVGSTTSLTTPGRCMNVKTNVSFELYCDLATGSIIHKGYPAQNCSGTVTAADTTTWAPAAATNGVFTNAEKCFLWKDVTGLYAGLADIDGVQVDTTAKLAALCAATAAPTAAPTSGAAAVGTAAAVAAGAAALIL